MFEKDYEDGSTSWQIPCDCGDPAHNAKLWFEVDEFGLGSLKLYSNMGVYAYWPYWKKALHRAKIAWIMLVKGRYEVEGEIVLDHDGIDGLRYALNEGQKAMRKAEAAFRAKRKAAKTNV